MSKDSPLKYLFADGSMLTMPQRILIVVFFYLFLMVMSIHDYMTWGSTFTIEMTIAFYLIVTPLFYPFVFYERYIEKHGMSKLRWGVSYQGWSRALSLLAPGGFVICIFLGRNLNHLMLGIFYSLAFIIPFLALFFRLDVFNDSNCCLGDEIVFGYPPNFYGFICLGAGLFGIYNITKFYPTELNYFVICLLVVLLFQILIIIPDIFNKYLPFEIRTKEGFIKFIISIVLIYLIVLFYMAGGLSLINPNIDWSLTSILRKLATYGTAIIITILFYKQAQKMNKKKK